MIDGVVVVGVDFSAIAYIISCLRILYNCLNLNLPYILKLHNSTKYIYKRPNLPKQTSLLLDCLIAYFESSRLFICLVQTNKRWKQANGCLFISKSA